MRVDPDRVVASRHMCTDLFSNSFSLVPHASRSPPHMVAPCASPCEYLFVIVGRGGGGDFDDACVTLGFIGPISASAWQSHTYFFWVERPSLFKLGIIPFAGILWLHFLWLLAVPMLALYHQSTTPPPFILLLCGFFAFLVPALSPGSTVMYIDVYKSYFSCPL